MENIISNLYKKHIINEGIYNWSYVLPKEKKEQIVDFYLLTMLNKPNNEIEAFLLDRAQKKLLINLKEVLLEDVFYCICSEITYLLRGFDSGTDSLEKVSKYFNTSEKLIYSFTKLKDIDKINNTSPYEKYLIKNNSEDYDNTVGDYITILSVLKKYNITKYDFVNFTLRGFKTSPYFKWRDQYGGKAWQQISKGWLDLYNANTYSDMIVYIDHVYDLIHNTDTVFDKLLIYSINDNYAWIKSLLTYKRYTKNVWELLPLSSLKNDRFIIKIIKETTGINKDSATEYLDKANKIDINDYILSIKNINRENKEEYKFTFINNNYDTKLNIKNYQSKYSNNTSNDEILDDIYITFNYILEDFTSYIGKQDYTDADEEFNKFISADQIVELIYKHIKTIDINFNNNSVRIFNIIKSNKNNIKIEFNRTLKRYRKYSKFLKYCNPVKLIINNVIIDL